MSAPMMNAQESQSPMPSNPNPNLSTPSRSAITGTGDAGLSLIKDFEKLKLHGYHATKDEMERGITTVGYGSTGRVKVGDKITEQQAEQFLAEDLGVAEKAVKRLVKRDLNQNEFDALVSLVYNVGEGAFEKSKALKALNAGDIDRFKYEAFDPKAGFTKQGGEVLAGLVRRRKAEMELFG